MRNGNGTYWVVQNKKYSLTSSRRLRREYTGEWLNDKKEGKGAFFYGTGDRYDG